jgi:hypothetical protein
VLYQTVCVLAAALAVLVALASALLIALPNHDEPSAFTRTAQLEFLALALASFGLMVFAMRSFDAASPLRAASSVAGAVPATGALVLLPGLALLARSGSPDYRSGMSEGREGEDFSAAIERIVRDASQEVVTEGYAQLDAGTDSDGERFLLLQPTNPKAARLRIWPDYPTLEVGEEMVTDEMFGSEDERLERLPQLIDAVIAGRFEWEYRQVRRRILFWVDTFTQQVGTFHTPDGPSVFTRRGVGIPAGAVEHHTYAPYRQTD